MWPEARLHWILNTASLILNGDMQFGIIFSELSDTVHAWSLFGCTICSSCIADSGSLVFQNLQKRTSFLKFRWQILTTSRSCWSVIHHHSSSCTQACNYKARFPSNLTLFFYFCQPNDDLAANWHPFCNAGRALGLRTDYRGCGIFRPEAAAFYN